MNKKQPKSKEYGKIMIKNAIPFLVNLIFIMIFSQLFGQENILPAVAIGVGLTMLPLCNLQIKPWAASGIIFVLYVGSVLIGQTALISPVLAFPLNFLFVVLIILLSNEPADMKPSISFLLCFVFSQSTCVPWSQFPMRFLCAVIGSLLVIITCCIFWHRKGFNKKGRTLTEQIKLCNKNHHYMFRMAFGISIAMLIGMVFHLKKPLWISIVVMSLTQLEFVETLNRMKYRVIGTILGIVLFFLVFQLILPQEYALYVIILLGYLGSFTEEYKYKQAINAVSALNASLVLLDTKEAILDRFLLLLLGIVIVLAIYFVVTLLKHIREHLVENKRQVPEILNKTVMEEI